MNRTVQIILVFVVTLLVASCADYEMDPTLNYGWNTDLGFVYQNEDNQYFIITDYNDTLEFSQNNNEYNFEDSMRILVYYNTLEILESSQNHLLVNIQDFDKILYKNIIESSFGLINSDSLGNDPIEIISIWQTGTNLNIEFAFYGGEKQHYINLSREGGSIDNLEQPIELSFRHNANGDSWLAAMNAIVTFNLESLRSSASDTTKYTITATGYDDTKFTYSGTVVFN